MPRQSRFSKTRALARLHDEIRGCARCPLHRTRTQAVPGVGPADATVMLIGEAPGRQEDQKGEPFVGQAGKMLDGLLAHAGLARSQVYITNVVKSRPFVGPPPGTNRPPAPGEIAACRSWLDEQIALIDPPVIVTLGRIALKCFFPTAIVSAVHGRPQAFGRRAILPLYHPAVALRRRDLTATLQEDVKQLGRLLAGGGHTLAGGGHTRERGQKART